MSVNYSSGLSEYEHKGRFGMAESFDDTQVVEQKVDELVSLMKESKHTVVITGAGLSTAAGIPDFRGPSGVWTCEAKGETPQFAVTFENARPTYSHLALVALEQAGHLGHLISQNVDGLHIRSGYPRNRLAELHGNMFVEECDMCHAQYIRADPVPTMRLQPTGNTCTQVKRRGDCRGHLHDTILDWEDALPDHDLDTADDNCRRADLCLCLGTSLQIIPCGKMPLLTKKNGGKIVIVNLQETKQDKKADIKIHAYADMVMKRVCDSLGVSIPHWEEPLVRLRSLHTAPRERCRKIIVDDKLLQEKKGVKRKMKDEETENKLKSETENKCEFTEVKPEEKCEQFNLANTEIKTEVNLIKMEENSVSQSESNAEKLTDCERQISNSIDRDNSKETCNACNNSNEQLVATDGMKKQDVSHNIGLNREHVNRSKSLATSVSDHVTTNGSKNLDVFENNENLLEKSGASHMTPASHMTTGTDHVISH